MVSSRTRIPRRASGGWVILLSGSCSLELCFTDFEVLRAGIRIEESLFSRESLGLNKTVNRSKHIQNREPPQGSTYSDIFNRSNFLSGSSSLRTYSRRVSSSRRRLSHNSREPKNSYSQSSDSSRLFWQSRSHFCPSYGQLFAIPRISAESRSVCEYDPPSTSLPPLHSRSAMPTFEGSVLDPLEVVDIRLSSGISGSRPHGTCISICYDAGFRSIPFYASFFAALSGSQKEAFSYIPGNVKCCESSGRAGGLLKC